MTYAEIKELVMHQIGFDGDDVTEFEPYIAAYVNEAYNELVYAYAGAYVPSTAYPILEEGSDLPLTPDWTHMAISNWATWCVYRNGSPSKQARGRELKDAFEKTVSRVRTAGGSAGITTKITTFSNIPD